MSTKDFQDLVAKHSLCPGTILYNSNALCGETGEVANQVKKLFMATMRPDWVSENEDKLKLPKPDFFKAEGRKELGDALFYLVRVGMDLGVTLDEIMTTQADKLAEQSVIYNRTFLK